MDEGRRTEEKHGAFLQIILKYVRERCETDGSGRCTGIGANHPSPTYQEEFGPPLEGREEAAGALADKDKRSGSKVRTQGVRELDCAE